jgi:hypothetical protein
MSQPHRPLVTVHDPSGPSPAPDLLGSAVPPERSRDWRPLLATVVGVAGVGVAATGIALAVSLSGGGPQPEAVLPADVFALAKVDLDPAGSQKVAAYELAKRFPGLGVDDVRTLQDDLLARVLADTEDLDYDKQVRPWIGARAAVAGAPDLDGDGEPEVLLALAYDDRAAAERLLPSFVQKALEGDPAYFAFSSREDYVLLAASQEAADAAAGVDEVLADQERYKDDIAALDGDQVAVAWADAAAVWEAVPKEARKAVTTVYGEDFAPEGRFVAGVRLEEDAVEVTGRGFGLDVGSAALTGYALGSEAGEGLVQELPSGAVVAASVAGLGKQVEDAFTLLSSGFGVAPSEGGVGQEDMTEALEQQFGIEIPEDLVRLLGDETALGVYDVDGEPGVGVRTRGSDPAGALEVAERLLEAASQQSTAFSGEFTYEQCLEGVPPEQAAEVCQGLPQQRALAAPEPAQVGVVGELPDGIAYGTSAEVLEKVVGSGGLGDEELFREVVRDADSAASVLYADLQAAMALFGVGEDEDLEALEAVGLSSSAGPDGRFRLRLTVR